MRKVLKWVGIIVGVLLLVVIIAAVVMYLIGRNNLNEKHTVQAEAVPIPTGDEALARGRHFVEAVSLCAECHGDDLGGEEFLDEPIFGSGDAPNLTAGAGGIGATYTVEDWVRAIRHGVRPNGETLKFMPADKYYHLSDDDLGAIIAYLQSVPPVDRNTDDVAMGLVGTIIFGNMVDLPYELIDHDAERPAAPVVGVDAAYGEYLITVAACQDCHGKKLNGDVPMGAPSGPDLRPNGELGGWERDDFVKAMRTGVTPDGEVLDHEEMPWNYYTRMTDDELDAIWLYLQTLD